MVAIYECRPDGRPDDPFTHRIELFDNGEPLPKIVCSEHGEQMVVVD